MLDSLSKSVDIQVFCVFFSSSVNQNGLFLNYWKKWVLCIRNRFHAKQHCVNLIYSIYNGLSIDSYPTVDRTFSDQISL